MCVPDVCESPLFTPHTQSQMERAGSAAVQTARVHGMTGTASTPFSGCLLHSLTPRVSERYG